MIFFRIHNTRNRMRFRSIKEIDLKQLFVILRVPYMHIFLIIWCISTISITHYPYHMFGFQNKFLIAHVCLSYSLVKMYPNSNLFGSFFTRKSDWDLREGVRWILPHHIPHLLDDLSLILFRLSLILGFLLLLRTSKIHFFVNF